MSAFKFLIDTNIVIGLEDNRPVDAGLTDLVRRCSANGVRLFMDAAVDDDIRRDRDRARLAITLSKLARFERLTGIAYPHDAELARKYGPINSVNDRSDCRLLYRGEKFGEQLLKQCLWFAQANGYDIVYVTAFPSKDELIQLLGAYGFAVTGRQDNGELVLEKVLHKGPLALDGTTDILALDRMCYPRFYEGERVAKYCVPIQGPYHEKLFPEISFKPQPPLFSVAGLPRERTATTLQERTPGNTIRKVYLCRAQTKGLRPGDILLFYLSLDKRLAASQSLTTIGVVEQCRESRTAEELVLMTARRSVFSGAELAVLQTRSEAPVKVIDFLLAGHITPPIGVDELVRANIFNGRPPQSIARLDETRYQRLRPKLKLGFD